jgi:hypothetical protein
MSGFVALRLTGDQEKEIKAHLFPGDGKEAAVIGLCGRYENRPHDRLLLREIHPIPYDVCTTRTAVSVAWPVSWLDALLERAARENLSIAKFHSHPNDYPRFSPADDRSDRYLFDGIDGWLDRYLPHASVVMLTDGRMFGRVTDRAGGFLPLKTIAVAGDDIQFWHDQEPSVPERRAGVGRPAAAFGQRMTAELAQLSLAIVGASGTGSIDLEQAGRLGFGRIVTVDPQSVEARNLNRIVNARREHAEADASKVGVAREAIEAMGLGSVVDTYPIDLVTREGVRAVAGCDLIIGCVDSAEARDVLNRISTYYLIPYIDVGVGIVALPDGTIDQVNGVVHYIQPGRSSLLSRRAYRPEQVVADALRRSNPAQYAELRREKYIEGADEDAPSVMSVNMVMASLAMNELLSRLYPVRNGPNRHYAALRVSLTEMTFENEPEVGRCQVLSRFVGAGDTNPLLGLPELSA